jgi:hypothetical protein
MPQADEACPEAFEWSAWPLRDRPAAAAAGVAAIAALAGLAGVVGGDLLWGLLSLLLLAAWLNELLLPTRFTADREGVVAHGPLRSRRIRWADATRLAVEARGGWLGRARGASWRRQGVDLFWGEGRRDASSRLLALAHAAAPQLDVRDRRRAGEAEA